MKNPRNKKIAAAFGTLILMGTLAACSSSNSPGSATHPVTISFWDNNGGPSRTPLYETIIKKFEAKNPSIKVNYVGIPASESSTKYQTAVAGGSVPDVGIVAGTVVSSLVGQNALVPLDSDLKTAAFTGQGKLAADAIAGARGTAPDGKLYVLPMTSTPDTIWYNGDLLKAAGLMPPTTWNDFYKDVAALNDPSKGVYGFGLRGGSGSVNTLVPVAYSCSGITSFFAKDGKTTLNDPKIGACLQKFADIYSVDTSKADISNGYQQMVNEFDSGKAALILHNLGSAADHVAALGAGVAIAQPMPISSITHKLTLESAAPEGPAVFTKSPHQAEALKFAEFLVSHNIDSAWNKATGQIPGNAAARNDSWIKLNQPISSSIAALKAKTTSVVNAPLYLPDWASISSDLAPDWQSVLSKSMTGQQFADLWAKKVNSAEAGFKSRSK